MYLTAVNPHAMHSEGNVCMNEAVFCILKKSLNQAE